VPVKTESLKGATVSEKPDKIVIRCEQCKRESSLAAIHKHRGICPACKHAAWHIESIYMARQDDGDAANLTLKALGFSLLTSDGVSITSPIPGTKRPVNGFDMHDVTAEVMAEIADPAVNPQVKLMAFVKLKESELFQQHRRAMERNGRECVQCGMLFVVSDQKPWTLLGACSKVCCAAKLGSVDYALVEQQVLEKCQDRLPEFQKIRRDHRAISACCSACGHRFELPRIYAGVHRKCPECGHKVLIPQD